MRDAQRRAASLFSLTLALGCAPRDPGSDSTSSASSTSTPASASESGSVTSAAEGSASATDSAPTTSTGTPTTSGSSSSTGDPCSFLSCETGPETSECDNWAQDCPEGQKCTAYIAGGGSAWDALKCVDITGTDGPGDPCTSEGAASGVDSCIKGAMCWGVNQEGMGTCVALCTGSPEAPVCADKGLCTLSASSVLILCLPSCDPLLQDCPNPIDVCYPIADGFTCAPDASGDEGQANDPCEFINVCDPGLMCADATFVGAACNEPGSTGCCTPFCKFPDGPCPNPDQQCVQYFDPADLPPDDFWLAIGVCGVPS